MTRRVILLGPPGSGKGTQSAILSGKLGLIHLSTGDIFREAIRSGSELGRKVESILSEGNLVPDALVIQVIRERLGHSDIEEKGFLLDGFPRTLDQARALCALLEEINLPLTHVIELNVSENHLLERIQKRGQVGGRADDNEEIAAKRLAVYLEQTLPVTQFFVECFQVIKVDGLGDVEVVTRRILKALGIEGS